MILQRIGSKSDINIKRSFFLSKNLMLNSFKLPSCKQIRILFPLYERESLLRSKSVIIMLEFLEQISGVRAIIKKVNLIVEKGLWVRGQVDLSDFHFMKFIIFFNECFLSHPLLRFSSKPPILRVIDSNYVKLIISNIDFCFDPSTRRLLPHTKSFWLEFDFFFRNNFILNKDLSISFYTQYFFSHHLLECQKI